MKYKVILNNKQQSTLKTKTEAFKLAEYLFNLFNEKVEVRVIKVA